MSVNDMIMIKRVHGMLSRDPCTFIMSGTNCLAVY